MFKQHLKSNYSSGEIIINIKKLLLTTALITSLSSTAMADVSISGEAKVNSRGGEYSHEADLIIIGKSGDTSVVAQIGLDNMNTVEQLYMTSKVAGIDVRVGRWRKQKSELSNGAPYFDNGVQASTLLGPVELTYRDFSGASGTSVTVAGTIGGVKVMHKVRPVGISDTKVSGSMGGVNAEFYTKDYTSVGGGNDTAITLSTSVQGVDLTYVNTSSYVGTNMDGFIGEAFSVTEANAFGVSTNILGNKITYKDIMINGTDSQKLILTRKIASGATFEATYVDYDDPTHPGDLLDLELAVKF